MTLLRRKLKYHAKIGLLGLSDVGKTVIAYRFAGLELNDSTPTTQLEFRVVETKTLKAHIRDPPGQKNMRELWWETVIKESDFLLYVVDISNSDTLKESKAVFDERVKPFLEGKNLFIIGNKTDIDGSMSLDQIRTAFNFPAMYYETSAATGENFRALEIKIWRLAEQSQK